MTTLTAKQERFVEEYLIDLNATQAAIRAGYSERTANEQGPRLLVNVSIAEAIAEAKAERAERTQITQDWVIERLVERAEQETGAVAVRALELLGKHLGMFKERVELTGKDGGPVETREAARERVVADVERIFAPSQQVGHA